MNEGMWAPPQSLRETWWEQPLWALAALVVVVGFVWMPAEMYPGDPMTMREETRAILLHGELAVEDIVARNYLTTGEAGQYVVDNPRNDRCYSKYGSMAAWMYLLPMGAELLVEGELPPFSSPRRVVYLNIFNVALAVLVAASLYRTARRFDATAWVAAGFVTLCFYTTYLWNYLRAQNSEIMQLLFFAWAVTGFLDILDERRRGQAGWAVARLWAACAALFLTKVSYVFVGPLFALGLLIDRRQRQGGSWREVFYAEARRHIIPATLMLAAWAALNWVKFGHPLLTGYHLWKPSITGFNGSLRDSLPKLLFSVQWGFVACFPVLALAIPFLWRWARQKPIEFGTLLMIGLVYVVLLGMLPSWTGAWCYGPRYWLFILPFVSLSAIHSIDWLLRRTAVSLLATTIVVVGLGCSTWLQTQVNRFPFFAYYHLTAPLEGKKTATTAAFFANHPYGWIEYVMWRHRRQLDRLPWWRDSKAGMSPPVVAAYEQTVRDVLGRSNLFFFPGDED